MKAKDLYFYLSAIIAVLIFLAAGFIIFNYDFSPYKYVVEKNGVEFASNTDELAVILGRMRSSERMLISPEFVQSGPENSYQTAALTLFSTIFVKKGKETVILARVVNEEGELVSCTSNFGDPKRNDPIDLAQCRSMLGDESRARVLVPLPPTSAQKSTVLLEGSTATVQANSLEALPVASFALAEAIYPDAKDIIDSVNNVLGNLK